MHLWPIMYHFKTEVLYSVKLESRLPTYKLVIIPMSRNLISANNNYRTSLYIPEAFVL